MGSGQKQGKDGMARERKAAVEDGARDVQIGTTTLIMSAFSGRSFRFGVGQREIEPKLTGRGYVITDFLLSFPLPWKRSGGRSRRRRRWCAAPAQVASVTGHWYQ